ncbi:MAG: hypothetical protein JWM43_4227 [Acidobacteriaceae bacterium]|nr:hypothetical protein [Acidobacteriaceae bacterium]
MSSAQLDTSHELQPDAAEADFALTEYPALKQEVAARLAAHRARRQNQRSAPAAPAPIPIASSPARARAARIAAAVAERYAQSATYREFLAAEAETAIHQAEAAAEVAAVTARAVAEAQLNLLEELDQYKQDTQPDAAPILLSSHGAVAESVSFAATESHVAATPAAAYTPAPKVTVRLYEDVAPTHSYPPSQLHTNAHRYDATDDEALDEEITFRQAPTFVESTPPVEIPANLLEFPRHLVAARKARPRLAEGPLREDGDHETDSAQLRIFEVEPAQISSTPAAASAAPEWTSILLDAHPVTVPTMVEAEEAAILKYNTAPVLLTAPLELRVMAAAVDTSIVLATMLTCTAAAVTTIGTLPMLQPITSFASLAQFVPPLALAVFTFLFLSMAYQYLFFTFSDATPGMRYARIGLCTFSDDNPSRAQMRRRIWATLLSGLPLGLGILWSWIDTDRIGWHDRISRTYQRSY